MHLNAKFCWTVVGNVTFKSNALCALFLHKSLWKCGSMYCANMTQFFSCIFFTGVLHCVVLLLKEMFITGNALAFCQYLFQYYYNILSLHKIALLHLMDIALVSLTYFFSFSSRTAWLTGLYLYWKCCGRGKCYHPMLRSLFAPCIFCSLLFVVLFLLDS